MQQIGEIITTALQRQSEQPNSELRLRQQNDGGVSLFAAYPPATNEYLATWVATMSAAFPNIKPEFWAICTKIIKQDGLSEQRLRYICDTLCRGWRYPTLQIADILDIDKQVKVWTWRQFYKEFGTTEQEGYCILEDKAADGTIQYCATADAKRAGLRIMRECFKI